MTQKMVKMEEEQQALQTSDEVRNKPPAESKVSDSSPKACTVQKITLRS